MSIKTNIYVVASIYKVACFHTKPIALFQRRYRCQKSFLAMLNPTTKQKKTYRLAFPCIAYPTVDAGAFPKESDKLTIVELSRGSKPGIPWKMGGNNIPDSCIAA